MANIIKGLERIYDEERDTFFYLNDQMLKDNILIEEGTIFAGENVVETVIEIKHLNDVDAMNFILYWDTHLVPIQLYRILKDITDLYKENSLRDFIEILPELSTQYSSASMQSDEKRRNDSIKKMKEVFATVRSWKIAISN